MKYYTFKGREHFTVGKVNFLMGRDNDGNWAEVGIDKKIIRNVDISYNKFYDKNVSDGFWVEAETVSE